MYHIILGLLLVGLAGAANAADSDQSVAQSNLDLSTLRVEHSGTDALPLNRASDRAGLVRAPDNLPRESAFTGTSQPSRIDSPGNEPVLARSARFQDPLRLEFSRERYKVTLRRDSASMEGGTLRIALRSGSTSVFWIKSL